MENNGPNDEESLSVSFQRHRDQLEYMAPTEDGSVVCKSFLTFENVVSPTAGTQFQTVDQGTASSRFIRSTMYNIPETEQLRSASKLPVAVTVRPFAPLLETEDPVPLVDMRTVGRDYLDKEDVGPIRCRRCRTYMNPAVQHTNTDRFTCNICLFPNNKTPPDYAAMLNPSTNQRVDVGLKPELHRGVYDILVPDSYNLGGPDKKPGVLHHVLLIDITVESIKRSLPMVIADAIRSVFYGSSDEVGDDPVPKESKKFAIILFDKRMHFFNLSSNLDSTQITICSDLDDPFIPFFEGLFVDPEESRIAIEDALNNIEQLGSDDSLRADDEPCFSVALRTAMLCLAEVGGGKITAVLSALPSWGPGALKFKDNKTQAATISPEVQKKVYSADNDYYKLLAKDFIKENVGLDCLVVSQTAVDLSNIGWLCSVTGGSVFRWSNFVVERDARDFTGRFVGSIVKTVGYQGQLKLRCSSGLQVAQYYGTSSSIAEISVVGAHTQDPVIPVLSEDHTFTILLEYDGKLTTSHDCHFQAALLYTDSEGVRKVRVINLVLAVSERLDDIFNFVDQDTVVTTIVRDTLSFVGRQTFKELRESLNEKLVEIFTQYRAKSELGHNAKSTLTSRLLMPDSLADLPMYILAFLKSTAIRDSNHISADARLEDVFQMLNMPIERLMYHLYPALVELHSLYPHEGLFPSEDANPSRFISLPRYKDLSLHKLQDGIYIMCDGKRVIVWVRPNANPLLIKDLFGDHIESIESIDALNDELPDLPTDISTQARNIIKFFNSQINGLNNIGSAGIQIVRETLDGSDIFFKEHLVEDGSKLAVNIHNSSYPDYLARLHKAIRVKLENDKTYSKVKQSIRSAENHETLAQKYIQF
ncbi:beta-sandwich domain of Sec23/24 [Yamadazyma tenuis ATCC 10573]|uniref:Beta-sandwich domain of Sec23/24 n=2 Tax=Candida tenuis TaxID=2315449 RepID=G3BFP4_CANTC|nr:beta-sandwich domain of Sec23/24 [Yamadazyma tenuis ATCC 10573]EGV60069.1 beta-sandwich domain of Sec23/24 [Yamadazyma tenuis ATCC 10573]